MTIRSLPIEIYIGRNNHFFAEIEWFLYKYFGKTRIIPCGRNKRDKNLCCCQPFEQDRIIFSENKTECYCKVCGKVKLISNQPINLNFTGEL